MNLTLYRHLSVAGVADVIQDREKAKKLWKPDVAQWLPEIKEGAGDPHLAFLRINVKSAQSWGGSGHASTVSSSH